MSRAVSETHPDPVDRHVGARVRARRRACGVSQTDLGDALGLTFQQVQKYERGANRISASKLYGVARALGAPIEFFFEGLPDTANADGRLSKSVAADLTMSQFLMSPEGPQVTALFSRLTDARQRRVCVELLRLLVAELAPRAAEAPRQLAARAPRSYF